MTVEQLGIDKSQQRVRIHFKTRDESIPGGTTVLQVHVDASGVVKRTFVLEGSGSSRLDAAAADSVKSWRFQPFIENGEAMAVTVVVPLTFPGTLSRPPSR